MDRRGKIYFNVRLARNCGQKGQDLPQRQIGEELLTEGARFTSTSDWRGIEDRRGKIYFKMRLARNWGPKGQDVHQQKRQDFLWYRTADKGS